jgi:general secretion pathway protein N
MTRRKLMGHRGRACAKRAVMLLVMTAVGLAAAASQERMTRPEIATPLTPLPGHQPNGLPESSGMRSDGLADHLKLQRAADGNPLQSIPLSALNATRERPLFSPARRPFKRPLTLDPPPVSAPPAVASPSRPQLALVGAILGDDDVAILRNEMTKSIARVKKGESYLGWTLQVLELRKAIFQKGPEAMILTLPNSLAKGP